MKVILDFIFQSEIYHLIFNNSERDFSLLDKRRLFPNLQISYGTLSVDLTPNVSLAVSYRPNNCSYNLTDVRLRQSFSSVNKPFILSLSRYK